MFGEISEIPKDYIEGMARNGRGLVYIVHGDTEDVPYAFYREARDYCESQFA